MNIPIPTHISKEITVIDNVIQPSDFLTWLNLFEQKFRIKIENYRYIQDVKPDRINVIIRFSDYTKTTATVIEVNRG
jgi:hypothetical protein